MCRHEQIKSGFDEGKELVVTVLKVRCCEWSFASAGASSLTARVSSRLQSMGEEMVRALRASRDLLPLSDLVRVRSLAVRGEGPVKRDSANRQAQSCTPCLDAYVWCEAPCH